MAENAAFFYHALAWRLVVVVPEVRHLKFTKFLAVAAPSFRAGRKLPLLFRLIQSIDYEKDL